jgi:CRP-like cAMP-binding protein
MNRSQIVEILSGSEFFIGFGENDILEIADICEVRTVDSGTCLFQQGDLGEDLFIVVEGKVHLERAMNIGERKGKVTIDMLGKGRVLGCWSTLLEKPHILMSTAVCERPTTVLVLKGAPLRTLMTRNRELGFNVLERLCLLLRDRIQAAYGALDKI